MKKYFLAIIFGVICSPSYSQIINISEIDGNSKRINLSSSAIVDINSNLELRINRDILNISINQSSNADTDLLNELQRFNLLLVNQKQILELLNTSLSGLSDPEKIEKLGDFSDLMSTFYDRIFENKELETKFIAYFHQFEKLPELERIKYNKYYIAYGIVQLNQEIANNLKELQKNIDQKRIRIQMSAFLNTKAERYRKVHIENFDDYNLGEFYEVPRWATSFSKEDIAAFNYTKGLADDLNALVDNNFKEIRNLLKNNISSYNCIDNILKLINSVYANKDNLFKTNIEVATAFLSNVQNEYAKLHGVIRNMNEWNSRNVNALELFNSAQQEFVTQATLFPHKIDSLVSILPNDIKKANQSILDIINELDSCKESLKEDLDKVKNIVAITSNVLRPSQVIANSGIDLGKDLFNYSIQDLPEFGFISLKNTGKRSNMDQLEVLLIIRNQDDIKNHKQGVIIEKHIITLQQVNVYSESNVSVILASPYNNSDKVVLKNKFQFAPAGSLLLKFGSRKCKTLNFLEPSIGFNISTPDFDLDGVPEIGLGGVISILQDVLSVGLSYNTKTDNPYWFFGLSLPFSTLGMPINTIETNTNK